MKAIEVINEVYEGIDPKRVLRQIRREPIVEPVSMAKMTNKLWPSLGWRLIDHEPGSLCGFEIQKGGKLWRVFSNPPGAFIQIWRIAGDEMVLDEIIKPSSWHYLLTHLKLFGLPIREAIDPKRLLRQVSARAAARALPSAQELHRILTIWGWRWEAIDGGPDGFWYVERAPPNQEWRRYQLRLSAEHGAGLSIYRLNADNRWVGIERLYYDNRDELFDRLRRLRLVLEAV